MGRGGAILVFFPSLGSDRLFAEAAAKKLRLQKKQRIRLSDKLAAVVYKQYSVMTTAAWVCKALDWWQQQFDWWW